MARSNLGSIRVLEKCGFERVAETSEQDDRIGSIRQSQASFVALGAHGRAGIESLDPQTGGSYPGRKVAVALVALSRATDRVAPRLVK